MAGEDTALTISTSGPARPTVVAIEDTTHRYSNINGGVAVGDVVYVSANDTVAKADANVVGSTPPLGVVRAIDGGTNCYVVHSGGIATGLSSLTAGIPYYLSETAGGLSSVPSTAGAYLVGVAINATSLLVCCPPTEMGIIVTAGKVGIGTASPAAPLHINSTIDAVLNDNTSGALVIGSNTGPNITIDNNEIMGRNNTTADILHLQAEGGQVRIHHSMSNNKKVAVDADGQVGIGTVAPNSNLNVVGSVAGALVAKSQNYVLSSGDATVLLNAGSETVVLTLPTAVGILGRVYTVKCIAKGGGYGANVATNGSEQIDGSSNDLILNVGQSVTVQSTGSAWVKIAEVIPPS